MREQRTNRGGTDVHDEPSDIGFHVVGGKVAQKIIRSNRREIISLVRDAYIAHGNGDSVDPPSSFLHFPEKPNCRIIAKPAYLKGATNVAGVKWISSFPGNIERGIPRASAALLLNDIDTGYPFACLEGSIISAARTAASAVLAARLLGGGKKVSCAGFIGNGIIAREIFDFFIDDGWHFDRLCLYDSVGKYSEAFKNYIEKRNDGVVSICVDHDELIQNCELITFATTALEPYVKNLDLFSHHPLVLNVSLRDLSPDVIIVSNNILDDVEHCLTANTSPHLAEQLLGNRSFVTGTLYDVMRDTCKSAKSKPTIFSPFGLGILDVALGKYVFDRAGKSGWIPIPDFYPDLTRW
ncbi:MAG: 2,3-diaminopropionate biosynthesis protein SbnB [Gammaproteobacteria bacterium]|nr:2,3-diaminopropionate biosynthesis protein SbnB [Gammaproteobacteria bacterium]